MTFIFRYRSLGNSLYNLPLFRWLNYIPLDVLQANEIAPHTSALAMPSQDSSPSTSNRSSNKKRKVIGDVQESVKGFEDRENALLVSHNGLTSAPFLNWVTFFFQAELAKLKDEKEQFLLVRRVSWIHAIPLFNILVRPSSRSSEMINTTRMHQGKKWRRRPSPTSLPQNSSTLPDQYFSNPK